MDSKPTTELLTVNEKEDNKGDGNKTEHQVSLVQPVSGMEHSIPPPYAQHVHGDNKSISSINDYMYFSIANALCCCLCFGIVAVIYSNKTSIAKKTNDVEGAVKFSKRAKKWNIIAFAVGCVISVIAFALGVYLGLKYGPILADWIKETYFDSMSDYGN